MAQNTEALVRADRLVYTYPSPDGRAVPALDGLSFSLHKERLVALIGPDGAGKSTLIAMLCGLLAPEEGTLSVFGRAPDPNDEDFAAGVGYMPQTFGLYTDLTCIENFELFAGLRGVPKAVIAERARDLLARTGLAPFMNRPAGKLSGGMKQKLGLACALAARPRLLLLDEPTVGVDPVSRRELWSVIEALAEDPDGPVCLYSTAYLEEAERADRVLFMENGRMTSDSTAEALIEKSRGKTFALPIPEEKSRAKAFRLAAIHHVEAADPASVWLDAYPEGRFVNTLLEEGERPPAEALPRAPRLEDSYALFTLDEEHGIPVNKGRTEPSERSGSPAGNERTGEDDETEPVIRAKAIRRTFGNFVAVADTTFDVRRGEIFGILGPNGAGKTTTFRMLCGLLKPSSGEIRVAGADLLKATLDVRAKIGYVAQKFSLYGRLTVRQNLRYFGRSYGLFGKALDARIAELLHEFSLEDAADVFSARLPGGAQRSLAMACGLIHRPDILFLDEATSGADLAGRRAFWRRITSLAQSGTTVVVTTHFMEEAEYCDRFLIQDAGKVVAIGTPDEIRAQGGRDGRPAATVEEAFVEIVLQGRRAAQQRESKEAQA